MLPRNVNKAYLSGKVWERWGSFVRLAALQNIGNAIVAVKANF
jgi:hypothetical protein